ncbi:cysteine proteinase inhibitor 3-like [Phragmites australis]|uniref:cysteine proteinase inhibitor 3-like n=1 Tax=Phragmites australis TaxID=29695 RepID=UPI002D78F13F|nr:cysteine proteinase inhibitor 3-like [Phragmites australis]
MPRSAVLFATVLLVAAAVAQVPGAAGFHLGGDESGLVRGVLAALREKAEAEDAARFAVAQHNRNQGASLEFIRVLKSKQQVVTGTLHDLILEAVDAGKKNLYSAKVWVKPWEDFKSVVEFRHVGDSESMSSTASDGSSGQAITKLSLQAHILQETRLHTIENAGLSSDLSSSS